MSEKVEEEEEEASRVSDRDYGFEGKMQRGEE